MNKKLKLTVDLPSVLFYSDVNKGNYLNREREKTMFIPSGSIKRIAYAFPTSTLAKELGFYDNGCFFVEYQSKNESNAIYTWHDTQIGGFKTICKDLLKAFSERKAAICKASTHYNPEYYNS